MAISSRVFSRHAGFFSRFRGKLRSQNDVSNAVSSNSLPKLSGLGPFVELPSFKPLGESNDSLNVKMPDGSKISILSGSIVAMNGDISKLHSDTKHINNYQFQEVTSGAPASLLVNGGRGTYVMINIDDKAESWRIMNNYNVLAWTGFTLELHPDSTFSQFEGFTTSGKGTLVIRGENDAFAVHLGPGEEFIVNPGCLIAANTRPVPLSLNYTRYPILPAEWRLRLQAYKSYLCNLIRPGIRQCKTWYTAMISKLGINEAFKTVATYTGMVSFFWRIYIANNLRQKPVYFKVKGPASLLIDNRHHASNKQYFSKIEMDRIIRNS